MDRVFFFFFNFQATAGFPSAITRIPRCPRYWCQLPSIWRACNFQRNFNERGRASKKTSDWSWAEWDEELPRWLRSSWTMEWVDRWWWSLSLSLSLSLHSEWWGEVDGRRLVTRTRKKKKIWLESLAKFLRPRDQSPRGREEAEIICTYCDCIGCIPDLVGLFLYPFLARFRLFAFGCFVPPCLRCLRPGLEPQ